MKFISLFLASASLISAQTFIETLTANNFTALLDAVKKANLTDAVAKLKNATVFVPTNAAFEQIKGVSLTIPQLQSVLLTHIVGTAALKSTDLKNTTVKSLNADQDLKVVVAGSNITINGITVVKADIVTSQGVAHVIEKVIIPSALNPNNTKIPVSSASSSSSFMGWTVVSLFGVLLL